MPPSDAPGVPPTEPRGVHPHRSPPRLLLAAGGATWESRLLPLLAVSASPVVLARRCVDVPDLVAAAAAGQGTVAAVAADLPGLDVDVVTRLGESGVALVAIAASGPAADRLHRLGAEAVLDAAQVAADPAVVVAMAAATGNGAPRPVPGPSPPEADPDPEDRHPDRGRLVAVWGPTGAPGRSPGALGLAAAAAAAGTETLLIDADVYGGATASMLAVLDEVSGLLAAARSAAIGSLDSSGLAEAARQVAPRLRVLTGLPRADRWTGLRPAALRGVLARARQGAAQLVVVDCGFCLEQDEELSFDTAAPRRNGATIAALEAADLVVVVGSADPLGLARLARGRHELREALPTAQVRLVVNRVRGGLGWSRDDVARTLLQAVAEVPLGYLPLDQPAVDACWINGQTLPEAVPQSALARAMAELSAAVGGEVGLPIGVAPAARRRTRFRR